MGMTMTEKVLAAHAGRASVRPGEIVTTKVDLMMGHELSTIVAMAEMRRFGVNRVKDPNRIVLVPDHFVPAKDIRTAQMSAALRQFADEHKIEKYFEVGRGGICHVVLPEKGLVSPGMLIVGGDSHSCTYGALNCFATGVGSTDLAVAFLTGEIWLKVPETLRFVFRGRPRKWVMGKDLILFAISKVGIEGATYRACEYVGEAVAALDIYGRLTMSNMAIEMGAKNGILEYDDVTRAYLDEVGASPGTPVASDPDAEYAEVYDLNVEGLEPVVSFPHSPDRGRPLSEAKGIKVDSVVLGSCTNARLEDLRIAAQVLGDHKVSPRVRMMVIPASQDTWIRAAEEGLLAKFARAGAVVSTPTCGPCIGGHMGVLGPGEVCFSTTNRNFDGRMGHREALAYLGNPAVAAATAVTGEITDPEDLE